MNHLTPFITPGPFLMQSLTLDRANQIVDRIQAIMENGGFLKPVALSKVGASSTAEALAALYLVTAETFQLAVREDNPKSQKLLEDFVRAAGGTGMWIVTLFRPDGQSNYPHDIEVDESIKDLESIDSFVAFLRQLDSDSSDYWSRVYARIGIANPVTSTLGRGSQQRCAEPVRKTASAFSEAEISLEKAASKQPSGKSEKPVSVSDESWIQRNPGRSLVYAGFVLMLISGALGLKSNTGGTAAMIVVLVLFVIGFIVSHFDKDKLP
jgi:hypothetical protein